MLEQTLSSSESEDSEEDSFRSGIAEMSGENHEDLDQTSIESEVFDIDLDGCGISDGEDVNEGDDVNERESVDMAPTTSANSLPYTAPQGGDARRCGQFKEMLGVFLQNHGVAH